MKDKFLSELEKSEEKINQLAGEFNVHSEKFDQILKEILKAL